ncbi:MAG: hypothetical protein A3E78_13975 [Alphaproteobacteria bacterium RIFCSPHIGHO2_12_FULL_63_12]|nr:MAG: hypothetical protein A3E78_13975 [Alphaproteobacteria bacterium RIFCSPHIGHO2_12_FULL_63_12]
MSASFEELINSAVARAVAPLVEEVRSLREALAARPGEFIGQAELGRMVGLRPSALSQQLTRGKSEIARLPRTEDALGRRRWRRADVEALLVAKGGAK